MLTPLLHLKVHSFMKVRISIKYEFTRLSHCSPVDLLCLVAVFTSCAKLLEWFLLQPMQEESVG